MIDWSELGNWQEYTKFFIAVFVMVSPQIVIPLFVGVVGGRSTEEKKKTGFYGAVGFGITMSSDVRSSKSLKIRKNWRMGWDSNPRDA